MNKYCEYSTEYGKVESSGSIRMGTQNNER
jgi:hypothetical protein